MGRGKGENYEGSWSIGRNCAPCQTVPACNVVEPSNQLKVNEIVPCLPDWLKKPFVDEKSQKKTKRGNNTLNFRSKLEVELDLLQRIASSS